MSEPTFSPGGRHDPCDGCGYAGAKEPSPLSGAVLLETGLLPWACPKCMRHVWRGRTGLRLVAARSPGASDAADAERKP
jgi:hypothetical protein